MTVSISLSTACSRSFSAYAPFSRRKSQTYGSWNTMSGLITSPSRRAFSSRIASSAGLRDSAVRS